MCSQIGAGRQDTSSPTHPLERNGMSYWHLPLWSQQSPHTLRIYIFLFCCRHSHYGRALASCFRFLVSCLDLSCLVLSCLVLSCLVLSCADDPRGCRLLSCLDDDPRRCPPSFLPATPVGVCNSILLYMRMAVYSPGILESSYIALSQG